MSTQQEKVIKPMLGLLALAKQPGKMYQVCQIMRPCRAFGDATTRNSAAGSE